MNYIGDFSTTDTVDIYFSTNNRSGARVAPSDDFEAADIVVYKNGSTTQRSSTSGITITTTFDSLVGIHHVSIDLTDDTDTGFWAAQNDYTVVLYPDETIDGQDVSKVLAQFSIENRVSDVRRINGELTNDYNATLKLKQLDIQNDSGIAFIAHAIGGNYTGISIQGYGTGAGLRCIGGDTAGADGMYISGGSSGGRGVQIIGTGTVTAYAALQITAADGHGVSVIAGTNKDGVHITGNGSGSALNIEASATGRGIYITSTAMPAITVTSTSSSGILLTAGSDGISIASGSSSSGISVIGGSYGLLCTSTAGYGVDITGITGNRIRSTAGNGLNITSGTDVGAKGLVITSSAASGDGDALELIEAGTGQGIEATEINTIISSIGTPSDLGSGATLSANTYDIYSGLSTIDGEIGVIDGVVDSIKVDTAAILIDTTAIVAKLPSGTISDYDYTVDTSDGITHDAIFELVLAMVNGRFKKDYPSAGQVTFYQRDNITPLFTVDVTTTERTRV